MKRSPLNPRSKIVRIWHAVLVAGFLSGASLAFLSSGSPQAVRAQDAPLKPLAEYAIQFAESGPAGQLPAEPLKEPPPGEPSLAQAGGPEVEIPMFPLPRGEATSPTPSGAAAPLDAALQAAAVAPAIPAPLASFDGLSFQDNLDAGFSQLSPPDPNGDVGPNHYVQMINLLVRVYDKAGNPLTAPFKLSSLFATLGGQCAAPDEGDGLALYDPLADRWILSQFAFLNLSSPPYHMCIAVSRTGDPTGGYFLYDFIVPGAEFPDYPKLAVWPDGYYMTDNQFTNGGPFNGAGVFAFDRKKMLAGDPTASFIYFNLDLTSHPEAIGGMLPSDFDGLIPPPPGRPNTFAYVTAAEFGDPTDALRLFDFHADFANPASSTFTERPESPLPVAAFDPRSPTGRNDIQQPPPATDSNALDSISDRLLHRLQYRNFGASESLVVNHTVNASGGLTTGTYRAGVRYYQLTSSGGPFSLAEQATFAPTDGNSRWMGSAAVDNQGNLAVGYSVSGLATFPSIRYAGRLATDPAGGLFQGENTLVDGTGVQTSTSGRWGDYSALSVDPADDCTFWYTNEYYTAASQAASTTGWLTRIGSFRFTECTPPAQGTLQGTVTDAGNGAPLSGALVEVSGGFSRQTDGSGGYSLSLPPGAYTVSVSKFGYQSATATVTITDGAVTVQDFALAGVPVIVADEAHIVGESFSPANGAIDPAETVTVTLGLKNVGAAGTIDLVATLLPTGGVQNPSAPQSYGAIPAYGGVVTRPFTFRADLSLGCGGTLTATLQLQDGPADLGTVSFQFILGNPVIPLQEDFDSVTEPALPSGWTAVNDAGPDPLWVTSSSGSPVPPADSPPNAAFVDDPAVVSDKSLLSPAFPVQSATARLTFRSNYNLEAGFDGGVLEISLDGGAFEDILVAGGSFASGGYNRTIALSFGSPIAGRQAWSGSSGGFVTTQVDLPASAAGKTVQLRWRMASDRSASREGWRVDAVALNDGTTCTFDLAPAGSAITSESFAPGNGAIDPGEQVTVDLTLQNDGLAATTNLTATLLPTGGVQNPSAPQSYGTIPPGGGAATAPFSFRADPSLSCGGTLTATLQLQDDAMDLGVVHFPFMLGVVNRPLLEDFDGVTEPALPSGWTAVNDAGPDPLWVTSSSGSPAPPADSPPNAAFVDDPAVVSDKSLLSPAFPIQSASARLTFRHNYNLEAGFDGGVLEISLDGGAFEDILTAGGSFVSEGYNRTISSSFGSPIAGRQAWSGSSGGFVTTQVDLPASAAGKTAQLRWRMASDRSSAREGWRVDSISLTDGSQCDADLPPAITADPASQSVQYSDPLVTVAITATDSTADLPLVIATTWNVDGGAFTPGLPDWLGLNDAGCATNGNSGACAWSLTGTAMAPPGAYRVRLTVSDSSGQSAEGEIPITITAEDALPTYTGPLYNTTASVSDASAVIPLAATVQDISTTGQAGGDASPGDIRNATLTFVNRLTGQPLPGCAGLPVALLDPGDLQTGAVSCNWKANLSGEAQVFRIGLRIAGFYWRDASSEDILLVVAKPLPGNLISGAGSILLSGSAGALAGDDGSQANFGFYLHYEAGGANPQGRLMLLIRRSEAGSLHTYQVLAGLDRSFSMDPASGTAVAGGMAGIQDITNPAAPLPLGQIANIEVRLNDNGDAGSADTIAITIRNYRGELLFANRWDGANTVEQPLDAGNLVVR